MRYLLDQGPVMVILMSFLTGMAVAFYLILSDFFTKNRLWRWFIKIDNGGLAVAIGYIIFLTYITYLSIFVRSL
jgi:hypothetical protein